MTSRTNIELDLPAKDARIRDIKDTFATVNGGLADADPEVVAFVASDGVPVAGVCGTVGEAVGAEFEGERNEGPEDQQEFCQGVQVDCRGEGKGCSVFWRPR